MENVFGGYRIRVYRNNRGFDTLLSKDEATFLAQNGYKITYAYDDNPKHRPIQGDAGSATYISAPDGSKLNYGQVRDLLNSGGFHESL